MGSGEAEEGQDRIEYKGPEEELPEFELVYKLLKHYMDERDNGKLEIWWSWGFDAEVDKLESLLREWEKETEPKDIIRWLTVLLKDESDRYLFTRTEYITSVMQALYNLNLASEFEIDISDWPEDKYFVGKSLTGKPDKRITLKLYGDTTRCCLIAEYCDFSVHGTAEECGGLVKHCNLSVYGDIKECGPFAEDSEFTVHSNVKECGRDAERCTFSEMPGAEIRYYLAWPRNENVRKRLAEVGELEVLSPKPGR